MRRKDERRPGKGGDAKDTSSNDRNHADQAIVAPSNYNTLVMECASDAANLAHDLTRVAVWLDSRAWAAAALHVYDAAILIHQAIEEAAS